LLNDESNQYPVPPIFQLSDDGLDHYSDGLDHYSDGLDHYSDGLDHEEGVKYTALPTVDHSVGADQDGVDHSDGV